MPTTEQIKAGRAWIQAVYDAFNSNPFDIERWLTDFYQPDAVFTHGSHPPLKGHKEISAHLEQAHKEQSARHVVKHIDVVSDRIYVEIDGYFIRHNDPEKMEIMITGVAVFHKKIDENKTSSVSIYMDPTPLIERIKVLS
jgi:ketosteroid isomerase-like protein